MILERLLLAALLVSPAAAQGEPPKKPGVAQRFQGRVLDAAGNPVVGAGVAIGLPEKLTTADALERPVTRSGGDGNFQFDVPAPEDTDRSAVVVIIAAPGKAALRWTTYLSSSASRAGVPREPNKLGDLRLVDGVALKGRVRSTDGRPLVGARIDALDLVGLRARGNSSSSRSYVSTALAEADGSFVLPCSLPSAVQIVCDAEGHYRRTLSPVSAGQPLVVELAPSGQLEGRVVDDSGAPVAASVSVTYETDNYGNSTQSVQAGDDGNFRFTLRYPCRYRVMASRKGGRAANKESGVLAGPQVGIELRVGKPQQKKSLVVHAVDAATGAPIPTFRASAYWYQGIDATYLEQTFDQSSVPSEDGKVVFPEPGSAQVQAPMVRVAAEGFAPLVLESLELKEDAETVAEAKLGRESVVEGRVLDEKTGKPVAGCEILARSVRTEEGAGFRSYSNVVARKPTGKAPKTGEDGSFKTGGLGKGVYELFAVHRDRPPGRPVRVTLGAEETKKDAELRIPSGCVLAGKISGVGIVPGLKLRLERPTMNRGYYPGQQQDEYAPEGSVTIPVEPDGSYRFEGQSAGTYELALLYPTSPRMGSTLRLLIDAVRLRGKDLVRDLDVAEDLPGTVAGKVSVEGVSLPAGRWLVTASEVADPNDQQVVYVGGDQLTVGRRALIQPDGTYELLLPTGEHRLQIVDLETGVLMARDPEKLDVLAAKRVQRDLAVKAVEVRVRLRGDKEDKYIASRLKIDASVEPDKPQGMNMVFMGGSGNAGPFEIIECPREVSFLVPPGDVKLAVHSAANRLIRGRQQHGNLPTIGDAELKAELGKVASLELKIEAPPEIEDEPAKDDEKGEGKEKAAAPVLGGQMARPAVKPKVLEGGVQRQVELPARK